LLPSDINHDLVKEAKTNRLLVIDEDSCGASAYILQQIIEQQMV
jgi:hypothetical protein